MKTREVILSGDLMDTVSRYKDAKSILLTALRGGGTKVKVTVVISPMATFETQAAWVAAIAILGTESRRGERTQLWQGWDGKPKVLLFKPEQD